MSTIYVLDDDVSLLDALHTLLCKRGYNVCTFTNSEDLLNAVSLTTPDFILLDVILPKDNGRAICTRLKQDQHYPYNIFLFSASLVTSKEMQQCGANGYIEKPFDIYAFGNTIKSAVIS